MQRDHSIDALRGLAIVLVVAGHAMLFSSAQFEAGPGIVFGIAAFFGIPMSTLTDPVFNVIYSFHMPLFAFVSGVVLWPPRDKPLGAQFANRIRGLLVPYFAWFVVLFFAAQAPTQAPAKAFLPSLADAALGVSSQATLWYLYAIFICTVIVLCLERVPGSRWLLGAMAVASAVWSTGVVVATLPVLYVSDMTRIFPFVVLGYLLGPVKPEVARYRWQVLVVSLVAYVGLLYVRFPIYLPDLQPLSNVATVMHSAGLRGGFTVSLVLRGLLPAACAAAAVAGLFALYLGRKGPLIEGQAWLGRRSLGIYAMHMPMIWWFVGLGVKNPAVLTVVAVVLCTALTLLLERIPGLNSVFLGQRGSSVRPPSPRHAEEVADGLDDDPAA